MMLVSQVVLRFSDNDSTEMGSDGLNITILIVTSIFFTRFAKLLDIWQLYS